MSTITDEAIEPERQSVRLIRLDDFEAPFPLAGEEGDLYRRRFSTLFVDESRSRRGGLGRVTYAMNARGEQLALKTLILPEGDDERGDQAEVLLDAFRREYECQQALANLHGFPRLYGFAQADGAPAIIMEWIEGSTLDEAISVLAVDDEGRLSPITVARLGSELFELVSRLSLVDSGLIHRDLSPANVMIRTSRHSIEEQRANGTFDLCLIDFGSSDVIRSEGSPFTESHATVRHATAEYAPPEMLSEDIASVSEQRHSPAIDVYAAGSILCELLGGLAPFASIEGGPLRAASPYRLKTEHSPIRPIPVHNATASLKETLANEAEVTMIVAPLAMGRGLPPDSGELRRALALVDEQIADAIMACLAVSPRRRPGAATMRDELRGLSERYAENVRRALSGEPLLPCMTDEGWMSTAAPSSAQRVLRFLGRLASTVIWVGVVVSASLLIGRENVARTAGTIVLLALPAVVALLVRGREPSSARGLMRGTLVLAVAAIAECIAWIGVGLDEQLAGALAATLATTAAVWCPLVLDYACALVPGVMREARRRLPATTDCPHALDNLDGTKSLPEA